MQIWLQRKNINSAHKPGDLKVATNWPVASQSLSNYRIFRIEYTISERMHVNESKLMIVEDPPNEFSLDQTRNPWIAKHFSGFCFRWF